VEGVGYQPLDPVFLALQWGHDEGVVEGAKNRSDVEEIAEASMGPRRRRRGRQGSFGHRMPRAIKLQWGHDEGVVEGAAF